jgi:predicted thioredoxin/glutaredoxin
MANEYNKAVIGHVIQSKVNGTNVEVSKLMEQELEKIAHQFALESLTIIQQYLPTILDGVLAEMRMKADKEYKCALLKGSKIEDDCR